MWSACGVFSWGLFLHQPDHRFAQDAGKPEASSGADPAFGRARLNIDCQGGIDLAVQRILTSSLFLFVVRLLKLLRGVYSAEGVAGVVRRVAWRGFLSLLARVPDVRIVQVGAFVGATGNDPIYRFLRRHFDPALPTFRPDARALLVEPEPRHFERLKANYSHLANIAFENVAVDTNEGIMPFYSLDRDPKADGFPEWLEQLGSLREDRMTRMFAAIEKDPAAQAWYLAHRRTIEVPTVRLEPLLRKHSFGRVDFLQIDTEGSDYRVLSSIDLKRLRPRFINYEHQLLGPEALACRAMVQGAGYLTKQWGQDTFCVRYPLPLSR